MNLNYEKYSDGLIPAVVQDSESGDVLMVGFMNEEAVQQTNESGRVTFFSRSRQRLWTKGETSGNYLELVSMTPDCDYDTLLIQARPTGPVCHTGDPTCFGVTQVRNSDFAFLTELQDVIDLRCAENNEASYVSRLSRKGIKKIAQKVGEEAVEVVIEATDSDAERFKSEAADLLFHFLILLRAKGVSFSDVSGELRLRRKS